jgi:hypothetical protein
MDQTQIGEIAKKIVALRLGSPCAFLLEAHIPFTSILHTASIAMQPLAAPIVGAQKIDFISEFFADRKNIELLIQKIESEEMQKA